MKERPIIFSGPMVRAVLEGRKTQTRRIVRAGVLDEGWPNVPPLAIASAAARCPYGAPGDRLWVRETFQPLWAPGVEAAPASLRSPDGWRIGYVATDGVREYHDPDDGLVARCKPAIHMPRWASRITLEVDAVRVERLQDISGEDARAEGVQAPPCTCGEDGGYICSSDAYRQAFAALWDAINGKRAPWASNPWVWAVSFRRLQ